jgi:GntR family transcriptional regulator/MocR family aminotransferase
VPDVSTFPRAAWLRSLRQALATMTDADLGYGDPRGVEVLRSALADYLGRVRGVVADPEYIVITNGYTQSLSLVCHALAAAGAKRIALEDPSNPEDGLVAAHAGLEPVLIGVDEAGTRVDELERADADAVVLTPAHQHPTGVVLTGERRTALLAWLRASDAIAIEDDYDAEYRYDRTAIGALQGLDPDRVIYAGSASKTLAPALRLGWLVVPPSLLEAVSHEKLLADRGSARIEQHAFADFLTRGELDRHLRRMRTRYRSRRDALVAALTETLPEAAVRGVAAGLHVTVQLPDDADEQAIREEAHERRVELETMADYRADSQRRPPVLLLGYAQMPEAAIRAGVNELAKAVRAAGTHA